jgi:integrase
MRRPAALSPIPASLDGGVLDGGAALAAELRELDEVAAQLGEHQIAANTRRAYAKAWRSFAAFCAAFDLEPLPAHPEVVRWYVAWLSSQHHETTGLPRYATATIRQYLAGVAHRHLVEGHLDPTAHRGVGQLVRGLERLRALRPTRKRPLLLDDLLKVIDGMDHDVYPTGVSAARDALALWLGWAGAMRRSDAAGLLLASIELHRVDGVHVSVGRSKADQTNVLPDKVVLPYGSSVATCAPCALQRWLALVVLASDPADQADGANEADAARARRRETMRLLYSAGYRRERHVCGVDGSAQLVTSAVLAGLVATNPEAPLLRATYRNRHDARIHDRGVSGDALGTMLRTRLQEVGIDPGPYGFHSLRSGHVTQARRNGAVTEEIMRQGRWRRAETVAVYDREWNPASRNSVTRLGL